jgi:O-antigen/teichoic acid export membrane protein
LAFAKRLLPRALAYSFAVTAGLLIAAPAVPLLLGPGYASTTEALRWLALLPVLKTMHYFVADSLTGAGHQGLRTLIQVMIALFNVGLNLWIIPAYSWRGAAWSSLASDALLAACFWFTAAMLRNRSASLRRATEIVAETC